MIGWIHDYAIEQYAGGAELTNQRILDHAPEWADVERCLPGDVRGADRYIVNNVRLFDWREWRRMMSEPYIVFAHDDMTSTMPWQAGKARELLVRADAVVALSPYHRDALRKRYRLDGQRIYTSPSAIDPAPFYAAPEKSGVLYVGSMAVHKGVLNVAKWAAEHETVVDLYGTWLVSIESRWVCPMGHVPYEQIPDLLARYETLVFLPEWEEAFGRVVAEAALSGCRLALNDNVGAVSWGWETRGELAAGVGQAHERFWDIVDEVWNES